MTTSFNDPSNQIDWTDIEARVARGEVNSDSVCLAAKKLAEIVCRKHYPFVNADDRKDLISEGVLKALKLLAAGQFDTNITSLKNYLYTGMRNEMQNHLYRSRKEAPMEENAIHQQVGMATTKQVIAVRFKEVRELLNDFEPCYGRYASHLVVHLNSLGFKVIQVPEMVVHSTDRAPINETVLEKLACLLIWRKSEDCLW